MPVWRQRFPAILGALSGLFLAPAHRAAALDSALPANQYVHEAWSARDGLPEGRILSLAASSDGYLWIGTPSGIGRFDGARYRRFEPGEWGLGQSNFARDLVQTSDGSMWAALVGGVARYANGRFQLYGPAQGFTAETANSIAPGPNGSVWVGSGEAGVWLIKDGAASPHPAYRKPGPPLHIRDLAVDGQGVLWAATDEGVVEFRQPVRRYGQAEGLGSPMVNVLLFDRDGVLWAGTRGGLSRLGGGRFSTYTTRDGLSADDVTALLEETDRTLWIGTRTAGLNRLRKGRLELVPAGLSYSEAGALALARDADGSLWVGTDRDLEVYREPTFRILGREAGLPEERILNVAPARSGGVWVVDGNGAVLKLERGAVRVAAAAGKTAGDTVPLAEAADGSLWVGGRELWRLRGDRWQRYPNPGGEFVVVMPESTGVLVAQLSADGRGSLSRLEHERFTPVPVGVPLGQVFRLFRDRGGLLWISTAGGGLVRVGPRGTRVFRASDGLPHDDVFDLEEDGTGDLWVGTRGGLARIRGDVVSRCDAEGVPLRSLYQLARDAQDRLWIAAEDGVYAIRRTDLEAAADRKTRVVPVRTYTTRDGLRSVLFSWRSPGLARTPDGRLWYATSRGVAFVDPASIPLDPQAPPVLLEGVTFSDRPVPLADPLVVPASERDRVMFRYTAPTGTRFDQLRFRFRLVGFDDDWSAERTGRTASYTNLSPGSYRFEVSARRREGPWGPDTPLVRVHVEPFWYETMAFRLGAILAVGLAAAGAYRLRVRGLRRRQAELTRTVEARTADLQQEVAERRRAEEEVRRLNEGLEGRVKERTAQIEAASQALAEEKERLSVTLRSLGEGVVTTDVAGRVVLMNPVAERCAGRTAREAQGVSLREVLRIVDRFDRQTALDPVGQVLASGGNAVDVLSRALLIGRDGEEMLLDVSAAPIRDQGSRVRGVVLVFRDVTERTHAEEHVQQVQKLKALGVLAGGIAHDFNNLLTGVFGHVDLARSGLPPGAAAARLEKALEVLDDARGLTRQLLTFSAGGRPSTEPHSLGELLQKSARFVLSGSDLQLRLEVPEDLWACEMDAQQVGQVINNLLLNARQATPSGGRLGIRARNVDLAEGQVTGLSAGRYLEVEIEDEGSGIAPEIRERVFEPFFTTKPTGTGLGLAIAHSIVKQHGGALDFDSQPGAGTTFRLHLPAAGRVKVERKPESGQPRLRPGQGRVLVMDDEPVVLDVAREALSICGYEVETAPNGEAAVSAFERGFAAGRPFDVVILDLTIVGGMGGVETLKRLREIAPAVKAIATSGYSSGPVLAEPAQFGFAGTLPKPYAIADLAAAVEAVRAPPAPERG